ncbi:MAG TPA: sortase [Streptosporangiaceae bacterium]|nr:sortase [Streptosporangiaceae bacterium]
MADTELAGAGPPTGAGHPAAAGTAAEPEGGPSARSGPAAAAGPPDQETGPPDQETGQATPPAGSAEAILEKSVLRGVGVGLLLLALVVLGFAAYLYGLSGVQEARAQTVLYQRLQTELAQVQGIVPPVGPTTTVNGHTVTTAPGSPVAILDIPRIGMRDMVVVQGTSPENLRAGPGHRPDTPFPGQPGVAQIYGRRATFGAPFGRIGELRAGDTIKAVTGQGSFTYRVAAVADSTKTIEDPAPNRLILLTASSPVIPTYYVEVDADLISRVQASPGVAPSITSPEQPMAGDGGALVLTMMWALALALVSVGGTVAAVRWSPWVAYLMTVPLVLAVLLNLYQNLAVLLPNLY